MSTTIHSPDPTFTGDSSYGALVLKFEDGVATTDEELPPGVLQYLQGAGYTIDGTSIEQPDADTPAPIDSRDVEPEKLGTDLRDAAVDPQPGDFLAPTNAGQADPHGPDVVSPEVHASQGVRPVLGGDVHVDEPEVQDDRETEHADDATSGDPIVPAEADEVPASDDASTPDDVEPVVEPVEPQADAEHDETRQPVVEDLPGDEDDDTTPAQS